MDNDVTIKHDPVMRKTTILNVAKDNSFWDAETEIRRGKDVQKNRMKVFSISNLLKRVQQLNS